MDDALPMVLWGLYFIEAQGYSVEQNIGFQDNISTMRLEVNGTMSSSKRTKHIKARYFFVKDKIEDGDLEVQYCPTEQMWTDVLNKPEQGTPFRKDRAALMNVPVEYDDEVERKRTHPKLLPKSEQEELVKAQQAIPTSFHHRSVLGDARIGNRAHGRNRVRGGIRTQ